MSHLLKITLSRPRPDHSYYQYAFCYAPQFDALQSTIIELSCLESNKAVLVGKFDPPPAVLHSDSDVLDFLLFDCTDYMTDLSAPAEEIRNAMKKFENNLEGRYDLFCNMVFAECSISLGSSTPAPVIDDVDVDGVSGYKGENCKEFAIIGTATIEGAEGKASSASSSIKPADADLFRQSALLKEAYVATYAQIFSGDSGVPFAKQNGQTPLAIPRLRPHYNRIVKVHQPLTKIYFGVVPAGVFFRHSSLYPRLTKLPSWTQLAGRCYENFLSSIFREVCAVYETTPSEIDRVLLQQLSAPSTAGPISKEFLAALEVVSATVSFSTTQGRYRNDFRLTHRGGSEPIAKDSPNVESPCNCSDSYDCEDCVLKMENVYYQILHGRDEYPIGSSSAPPQLKQLRDITHTWSPNSHLQGLQFTLAQYAFISTLCSTTTDTGSSRSRFGPQDSAVLMGKKNQSELDAWRFDSAGSRDQGAHRVGLLLPLDQYYELRGASPPGALRNDLPPLLVEGIAPTSPYLVGASFWNPELRKYDEALRQDCAVVADTLQDEMCAWDCHTMRGTAGDLENRHCSPFYRILVAATCARTSLPGLSKPELRVSELLFVKESKSLYGAPIEILLRKQHAKHGIALVEYGQKVLDKLKESGENYSVIEEVAKHIPCPRQGLDRIGAALSPEQVKAHPLTSELFEKELKRRASSTPLWERVFASRRWNVPVNSMNKSMVAQFKNLNSGLVPRSARVVQIVPRFGATNMVVTFELNVK
jgi:hypothetical protein